MCLVIGEFDYTSKTCENLMPIPKVGFYHESCISSNC